MKKGRYLAARLRRHIHLVIASRRGSTAVEYALIIALIVLAAVAAISQTGDANKAIWGKVNTRFPEAQQTP